MKISIKQARQWLSTAALAALFTLVVAACATTGTTEQPHQLTVVSGDMVQADISFILVLRTHDEQAYRDQSLAWLESFQQAPGFVEMSVVTEPPHFSSAGAQKVRARTVWNTLEDWQRFAGTPTWRRIMGEIAVWSMGNIATEVWRPGNLAVTEPVRPAPGDATQLLFLSGRMVQLDISYVLINPEVDDDANYRAQVQGWLDNFKKAPGFVELNVIVEPPPWAEGIKIRARTIWNTRQDLERFAVTPEWYNFLSEVAVWTTGNIETSIWQPDDLVVTEPLRPNSSIRRFTSQASGFDLGF